MADALVHQTWATGDNGGLHPAVGDSGLVGLEALDRRRRGVPVGAPRQLWRQYRRNRVALVALLVCALVVLFGLAAGTLADLTGHDYREGDLRDQFMRPFSDGHLLGTDANGRDVLVRSAYGARVSLVVAGLAAGTALVIGALVGAVAGYFGGLADGLLMRLVDVLLCVPNLSLLLLVSTLFRPGQVGLALVIAALGWAGLARVVRGQVLALREREYVDAARLLGASDARIIVRHVLPNVVPLMVVWVSLAIPGIILAEASLSFLGLGVVAPTPSWGNMLQDARSYYAVSWTNVAIPGLAIYLTVLAVNLVGDGLRDALDPRLKA